MKTKEFPLKPLKKMANEVSGKRVSHKAAEMLKFILVEKAREKAREVIDLTNHAGRNTVLEKDVKFVLGNE